MQPNELSQAFAAGHVGSLSEPNFSGRAASFTCGAVVQVSLRVDQDQRIKDAKFKAAGCTALVAAASSLVAETVGTTTAEAAALVQGVPRTVDYQDCEQLARDALLAAIRNYSDAARDDWEGDDALICTCFCVSERTIEQEIRNRDLQSVREVTAACSAGGGCRSCYPLLEDLLEDYRRQTVNDMNRSDNGTLVQDQNDLSRQ